MDKYLYHFESEARGAYPYALVIASTDEEAIELLSPVVTKFCRGILEYEIIINLEDRKTFETIYLANKIKVDPNEQCKFIIFNHPCG